MNIVNAGSHDYLKAAIKDFSEPQLVGQELVQQGAIHVLSFLLEEGVTQELAKATLESLRTSMSIVRAEFERRGMELP